LLTPRSPGGLEQVEKHLTAERWPDLIKGLASRPVDTYIPRFKMDFDVELSDSLTALGMDRALTMPQPDGSGAQFGGMSSSDDYEHRLYIGKVIHAARVDVSEKGTEAAAATVVAMMAPRAAVAARPFTPVFRADRPFVFLIRDRKTDTILFVGRYTQPVNN
ncbi:MAG: serpin family protein, partial [Planctomycetes bacterium]|nr:serpin family protein [Planctomycetota bacterium]